jgi:hypothetical protein
MFRAAALMARWALPMARAVHLTGAGDPAQRRSIGSVALPLAQFYAPGDCIPRAVVLEWIPPRFQCGARALRGGAQLGRRPRRFLFAMRVDLRANRGIAYAQGCWSA